MLCTIMILRKTGVGKNDTVNSIFDEVKFGTDAFQIARFAELVLELNCFHIIKLFILNLLFIS